MLSFFIQGVRVSAASPKTFISLSDNTHNFTPAVLIWLSFSNVILAFRYFKSASYSGSYNTLDLGSILLLTASFILDNLLINSNCCASCGEPHHPQPQPPPHQPNQAHPTGISYLFVSGFRWYTFSLLQLHTLIVLAASPLPQILVCAALLMIAWISSGKLATKSSFILQSAFLANPAISWMFFASPSSIPLFVAAAAKFIIASI